ncbi:hypothetical protein SO802_016948 [Lithocarpus litseifolius]|uniref:Uncharacterized protein n=1 Tax=Lithocarpus litseifolius TaxID=425828 RepID=A0AAW2D014_9ROSI
MSEQSSVCDGAGYDEVFQTGHEPKEGSSWSSGDESSIQSSAGKAKDDDAGGSQVDVIQVDDSGSDGNSDDDTSETSIRPEITGEQEAFILKVTGIPLEERKCRDLITPDALHAYCGELAPSEEARRLHNLSRQQMEAGKLKAQIRAAVARKKEEEKGKEGASKSLPKAAKKGVPKRKGECIEDRPAKKPTVTLGDASSKPPSPKRGAGKGLMTAQGPVAQEDGRCLLTHKEFVLERLDSILGKEDTDICAGQPVQELGDSGLFDLARAMVRMRAIQVKGAKNEELIARQRKRITNLSDGLDQYKDACRTLNGEIKELKEKLEEGARQLEQEREAKTTAEKELTSLLGQVETAKADAVTEFRTSQMFVDACAEYYGEGLEDCLKQVKSLYPHLDLSRVSMDDPVPSTPVGDTVVADDDTLSESGTHQKADSIVLAQLALDLSGAQKLPSPDPSGFEGFPVVQDPLQGDEAVPDAPVA